MTKWLKWTIILVVALIVKVVGTAIYVASQLEYSFRGFGTGISLANLGDSLNFNVEIFNPTMFSVRVKDLKIRMVNKLGKEVGSFQSMDLSINRGVNVVNMQFEDTELGILVQSYFNDFNDLTMITSGKLMGIIPFTYRYPMKDLVTE